MERVGEHPVPGGPLAVRWLAYELAAARAGAVSTARVELENAGSAAWQRGVQLSYRWLDDRGNTIGSHGLWKPLGRIVAPGERVETDLELRAPTPPGRYRLGFDLVHEERHWFSDVGNHLLEVDVEVSQRIAERRLAVVLVDGPAEWLADTERALAAQEEPVVAIGEELALGHLAPGCMPAPDWSRRVLDAHAEGFAAVAGSVAPAGNALERRRSARELAPYAPGTGRVPRFAQPLLCPSLIHGGADEWRWLEPLGCLPRLDPPDGEPWLYDGRIAIRARLRSGRPRG